MPDSKQIIVKYRNSTGFTAIEFLVSIGILAIMAGIGLMAYQTFDEQMELETASHEIISTLRGASVKTLASKNELSYGVHFEGDRYILFAGATYNAASPTNVVNILKPHLEFSDINFGGDGDVVFDRVTGRTADAGTARIRLKNKPTQFKEINVLAFGQAGFTNSIAPSGTRITDSRHVHFDMPSIQAGQTLRLFFNDFPNPNVTFDIPMVDYFNAGLTAFSWVGTINVNGQNQTLKIHTHYLDALDTTLSVHRDRRYNNKPVFISIDFGAGFQDIVSYGGDDVATVGGFGGTMYEQ